MYTLHYTYSVVIMSQNIRTLSKKIEKNPNKKTVEIVILQNKFSETYFNDMTTVDLHESPKTYCHDFSSTETS